MHDQCCMQLACCDVRALPSSIVSAIQNRLQSLFYVLLSMCKLVLYEGVVAMCSVPIPANMGKALQIRGVGRSQPHFNFLFDSHFHTPSACDTIHEHPRRQDLKNAMMRFEIVPAFESTPQAWCRWQSSRRLSLSCFGPLSTSYDRQLLSTSKLWSLEMRTWIP